MRYKIDLHIHTNSSPHAYSTLEECINRAIQYDMEAIAITNHGPKLPDSPHWWALSNQKVIPRYVENLRILRGVEANIIDDEGHFDLNNRTYKIMDIILCGFHKIDEYGNGKDKIRNTRALINMIKSNTIDVIVHMGNPKYPADYEAVIKVACEYGVAIEINEGSLSGGARPHSHKNCKKILKLCKDLGAMITLGSDSHISYTIGEFSGAQELITEIDFPISRIINSSMENLNNFLEMRKTKRVEKLN